jgi:DNA-binding CsgD family transcriptional regulator
MGTRAARGSPTAREREVARLVGLGLTNREIAQRLRISDRTVGAHIQNLLNKLSASNRAQIAAWSAQLLEAPPRSVTPETAPVLVSTAPAGTTRARAILVAGVLALCVVFPADHAIESPSAAAAVSIDHGDLVFEAQFQPDGSEFGLRYFIGDPDSSAVKFVSGGLEYSVLKPGGNTGNRPAVEPMPGFFAEYELSVRPHTNVAFWINFSSDDAAFYPLHQIVIQTGIEAMQLAYDTGEPAPSFPLGPQVAIDHMLRGRVFTISTLVAPPIYRVFLDGVRVIDVRHQSVRRLQSPSFAIFGDGGTVRLSALRVYKVEISPS